MNSLKLSKRVMGIVLSVLFVNAAFADATTDARIQAYKSNKLIPENIVLPTSTGAKDSDEVVVFDCNALAWNNDRTSNILLGLLQKKYEGWSIQDLKDAFGEATIFNETAGMYVDGWAINPTAEHQEMRDYLAKVKSGEITDAEFTKEEAHALLQEQFDFLVEYGRNYGNADFGKFPCTDIDFTGRELCGGDISECTGITAQQLMSTSRFYGITLPAIAFDGTEDFTGREVMGTDFSKCTGITFAQMRSLSDTSSITYPPITFDGTEDFTGWNMSTINLAYCTGITPTQLLSAERIEAVILPAIKFTGSEDFSNKSLAGTDLSKCTGLQGSQIASASSIYETKLPKITFSGNEDFGGKDIRGADFSDCTGLTGTQIATALAINGIQTGQITFEGTEEFNSTSLYKTDITQWSGITADQIATFTMIDYMRVTSAQYNEWKSTLQSKFKNKYVYVDGVRTKIQ